MFRSRHKQDKQWRLELTRDIPECSGVYLIECTATGNKYVGATTNLRRRLRDHLANMSMTGHHASFGDDYLNHGKESIRVEILEYETPHSELANQESYWHKLLSNDLCNIDPAKKHWRW